MKRLECLDGLRGLLAVYVMLGHMAPFSALPNWAIGPLSHGGAAVDVFFILSGLVIIRSLERCRFDPRSFLILRATRIFPVFLAMFALGVALQPLPVSFDTMPWIGPDSLARDIWSVGWPAHWDVMIAAHLTMTYGLFPNGVLPGLWVGFLGASWSLSTEWQFYVLALGTGPLAGRRRTVGSGLFVAGAGRARVGHGDARRVALQPGVPAVQGALFRGGDRQRRMDRSRNDPVVRADPGRGVGVVCRARRFGQIVAASGLDPVPGGAAWHWAIPADRGAVGMAIRAMAWRDILSDLSRERTNSEVVRVRVGGRVAAGDGMVFTVLWIPAAVSLPIGVAMLLHRYVEVPFQKRGHILARRETRYAGAPVRML